MRLKPTKLIVHKLGPFDHLELNWDNKDSRRTLIVAENGLGKTTLVAALAACLSFGNEYTFPLDELIRFAHDETAYAYLELDIGGKTGWVFYSVKQFSLSINYPNIIKDNHKIINLSAGKTTQAPIYAPDIIPEFLALKNPIYLVYASHKNDAPNSICSFELGRFLPYLNLENTILKQLLNGVYGTNRNIHHAYIDQYKTVEPLEYENLNPFVSLESEMLLQFVTNQYINHALALADDKPQEAIAYKQIIERITEALSDELQVSVQFTVKRNPLELELTLDGVPVSIDQLSDGTRSFMSWILDYLMRASYVDWKDPTDSVNPSGIVVVDEIDSHLHPEWQRRIMSVVSKLLPNVYLIATTHSPFVLASAEDTQVFRLYRDGAGEIAVQSNFGDLYGYPADLVLEKAFSMDSLYPPEIERKLNRLSELAGKMSFGTLSEAEQTEHDELLQELAKVNPWLNNLLNLAQTR
ncbi:ATP-binding protein [Anaerolineales bacterium HSG25]|nr:ATP-binding protein [Anaerolineales bacterium HSG25]